MEKQVTKSIANGKYRTPQAFCLSVGNNKHLPRCVRLLAKKGSQTLAERMGLSQGLAALAVVDFCCASARSSASLYAT
jgi:hypothetical protein